MRVADAPLGEAARRIVSCDELAALLEAICSLSEHERRDALIDLGIHVSAQRMREEGLPMVEDVDG